MQNSSKIIVRSMNLSDVDAVHAIETASITPPWTKQGFADGLANENARFYVVEMISKEDNTPEHCESVGVDEKMLVAYCGLYFAADEGEITNVAVLPECRRQGVADALLEHVLDAAHKLGLSQIFLEVRASNVPAQELYKKHGFIHQGIRKNFYRDPKEDAVVMMCCL